MGLSKRLSPRGSSSVKTGADYRRNMPVYISVAASLALMGDSLLYAVLATQASVLGIPLVFVGVLLSINRFVRLISNTWASSLYSRFGLERPFVVAMVVASLTTFAYALPAGVWLFLLARIFWGISWSFLNLGMYFSVLSYTEESRRGQWMGRTKAISRFGTILSVIVGGYMTDRLGFRVVVVILGVLALAGACFAYWTTYRRPHISDEDTPSAETVESPVQSAEPAKAGVEMAAQSPNLLYGMSFMFGFVMHGVIVGTIALLVTQRYGETVGLFGLTLGVATLSGLLIGVRWIFEILFSPAGGRLGDRVGAPRVVPTVAVVQAVMLGLLSFVYNPYGLIILACLIFLMGVVLQVSLDAVAGHLAVRSSSASQVMSRYVTAQDFGAAVGPLVGYLVGLGVGLDSFYVAATVAMMLMALAFSKGRLRPKRTGG